MTKSIGQKFNEGKHTLVGTTNRKQCGHTLYKIYCVECAKDPELYSDGVFESTLCNMKKGQIPCGCSKSVRWTPRQYDIILNRKSNGRYEIISKDPIQKRSQIIKLKCNACDFEWDTKVEKLLSGRGCWKCGGSMKLSNPIEIISERLINTNITFDGFVGGEYNNTATTRLKLRCGCGYSWTPTYNTFVGLNRGCPVCANYGYSENKPGTLYVVFWENDFSCFVKYGISNRFKERLTDQMRNTDFIPTILFSAEFDGKTTKELEFEIDTIRTKLYGNKGFISKDLFPDGHTETFSYNDLDQINDLIYSLTLCRINK